METPPKAQNLSLEALNSTVFIFCGVFFMTLGLEFLFFQELKIDVYRILDNFSSNILLLFLFLMVQYVCLRKMHVHVDTVYEFLKGSENKWIYAGIALFLAGGIYCLFPSNHNCLLFFGVLIITVAFSYFAGRDYKTPFKNILLTILFSAGLDASLVFWMHEEANEEIHLQYARQLASSQDSIAEDNLRKLVSTSKDHVTSNQNGFWEKKWVDNAYLSSNYRYSFHSTKEDTTAKVFFQPMFTLNDEETPVYEVYFPEHYKLSFTLIRQHRQSVYTPNVPYKNMERIKDYQYAVVDKSKVLLSNTHDFDQGVFDIPLPPIGKVEKVEWSDYDVSVYHHKEGTYVLIGEPLSEFHVWISNFAFYFSLLIVVVVFWELLSLFFKKKNPFDFWQKQAIQYRIQITLLTMTLVLFFIIAITTFIFLHQNNLKASRERQVYIAETLRQEIMEEKGQYGWALEDFSVSILAELADRKLCDIDFYNANGELILSSIASAENSPAPPLLDKDVETPIWKNPATAIIKKGVKDQKNYLRTYFGILEDKQIEGFVAINAYESEIGSAHDIPIIMSRLLSVYVFLLLLTWGGGLFLIDLLTQPLQILANSLRKFKLGESNEKLSWEGDDAIGRLISEYNKMVDEVEQTARELARKEREGAWKIMAQQIAHEVNNPLTPLRLNIQYLTYAFSGQQTQNSERIQQISNSLLEQVDHLARVASQFKLFAKMDSPEAHPLEIKGYMKQFFSIFERRKDYAFTFVNNLSEREDPVVNIDGNHLQQVLHNIINNAEQAIPSEKVGQISLGLKVEDNIAVIEVADNGKGIDTDLRESIFDPSFSTKSTGTGLGLPICRRIVEFYGGELSFDTETEIGTCFRITLPVRA